MSTGGRDALVGAYGHVVDLYESERELVAAVSGFLCVGFAVDEVALVIATPPHRHAVEAALRARGADVPALRASGRYRSCDAAETLTTFMGDGHPDSERFLDGMGRLLSDAAHDGRRVRVFGEMVALLWEEGNVAGAIELERLWNELGRRHDFLLYCAYPVASVAETGDLSAAGEVCRQHSSVVTPRSYSTSVSPPGPTRNGSSERSRFFVPVPLAARAVRRFVREALTAWGEPDMVDDGELVVSELASNVLLHAGSPFLVSLSLQESTVRIAVHDASAERPERRQVPPEATSGRGVGLVEALSGRWSTVHVADGKIVWAELGRPPKAPPEPSGTAAPPP